jgi:glutamate-1-semialdehyde 2,1-aminomutase
MNKRQYLSEILDLIPSGAQTLSKNLTQYVVGVSPVTIERAKGVYLWDEQGDRYLDTMLALGPMVFGYANDRIDQKVKEQIDKGSIFSLPSEHELKLAQMLKEVVPCADMSRFVMDGNDATTGAVRLARQITGRDHVAKCGYHGYQDWSICTKKGRNLGIPDMFQSMTHDFKYNDVSSLEKIFADYPDQIAAVIMEPVSAEPPTDDFLKKVKEVARKHGAILIFDEMVTGFRWALGGAQEYFGVVPDMACFSKGLSNGYPLAVICGKREVMKRMDEVFVSMTFAGHALGLVAAQEVITMMKEKQGDHDVHKHMHTLGEHLIKKGNEIVNRHSLPILFVGYGPHPVMTIKIDDEYHNRVFKTYIYQEMNKAGILYSTSMMIGYAHTTAHVEQIMNEFEKICDRLATVGTKYANIEQWLEGDVIAPRTVRIVQ